MYLIPFVMALAGMLAMVTGYFFSHTSAESATGVDIDRYRAAAMADNFIVYRAAVQQYAEANPAITGTVATLSLPLPPGFTSMGNWTNTLTATTVYVYSTAGVEGPIFSAQPDAPWLREWVAGYNQNGTWVTGAGNGSALPAYIPNGSVVSVIQR